MSRPRIRSLKPESLQHPKVGKLSDRAFRLWVGLITQADDEGRLRWRPDQFSRIIVFGYHEKVTATMVSETLLEIVVADLAYHYVVDDKEYVELHDWKEHQKVDRPVPSILPVRPHESSRALASPRADLDLDLDLGSGSGSERNGSNNLAPKNGAAEPLQATHGGLLLEDAVAVEAGAVEVPTGSARPAGHVHVADAAPAAPDPAAPGAPASISTAPAPARPGHPAVALYCEAWKVKYGHNPDISGKDAPTLVRLSKKQGIEEYSLRLERYLRDDDPFLVKLSHPAAQFESRWNALGVNGNGHARRGDAAPVAPLSGLGPHGEATMRNGLKWIQQTSGGGAGS